MNRAEIVGALRSLTHKQFVELFYEAVQGRFIYDGEEMLWDAHLVLANAIRDRTESDAPWRLELLCPTPGQEWVDDAPICQHGEHCDLDTMSWAKESSCPVCGGRVYGT
jgi:hypothetical protein